MLMNCGRDVQYLQYVVWWVVFYKSAAKLFQFQQHSSAHYNDPLQTGWACYVTPQTTAHVSEPHIQKHKMDIGWEGIWNEITLFILANNHSSGHTFSWSQRLQLWSTKH